jgi:hypothetical protein
MDSELLPEGTMAAEAASPAPGATPDDAVATPPASDGHGEIEDEPIAAGPEEGPYAEGMWRTLRWYVHWLMVVFHHPEDLPTQQIDRRTLRLIRNWLRGVEGLARRLLVLAAAGFEIGKLPALRPRNGARPQTTKPADGKRRCSFRVLNWDDVCRQPPPLAAPMPFAEFVSRPPPGPPKPRRPAKRKSRYHPEYNPHYRDEFDPPPPPRLYRRPPGPRPKKIDNNPWTIFPPEPEVDDGKRWPGLPYARRIEALRWLVWEPEKAVRRLALRIARQRDGWEKLALIRDPERGKIAPPAWDNWFDVHCEAKSACLEKWKQAYAAREAASADTS